MTSLGTIKEALDKENWTIRGRMTHKRIFVHRDPETRTTRHLLTLTLMDVVGDTVELKTWATTKAYCVYRKVSEDHCYEVSGVGDLDKPNKEYSTSRFQTNYGWWIDPIDDIQIQRHLSCSSNFERIVNVLKHRKPFNVLGVFHSYSKGPSKNLVHGVPTVQGYFVTLADDTNCLFNVLVWHTVRVDKSKFALFNCKKGDTLLIPACRLSYPPAGQQIKTLTTTCSPVVDSECVSPNRIQDLKRTFNSAKKFTQIVS